MSIHRLLLSAITVALSLPLGGCGAEATDDKPADAKTSSATPTGAALPEVRYYILSEG